MARAENIIRFICYLQVIYVPVVTQCGGTDISLQQRGVRVSWRNCES